MKTYQVDLTDTGKIPAFGTQVIAPSREVAIVDAKVLAKMSGWAKEPKKAVAREV